MFENILTVIEYLADFGIFGPFEKKKMPLSFNFNKKVPGKIVWIIYSKWI